ncbi:MAG: peptidoglycan bridge formation glycyltransferase FemA/FemB family protein [Candidatus Aminicenantales bacterium]
MRVQPVEINWHPELPIFAKESFLKAVSDEYGWLGGFAESGELRCVLPYTIVRKAIFRMVRFRVETIPMVQGFDVSEEKAFLNGTIHYFRSIGADMVIPATTNTIFRTYPDGADAAPYGTYIVDLCQPEDVLWKNLSKTNRLNISSAIKKGVDITNGIEQLDKFHDLVKDTFGRSKLPFMDNRSFQRYVHGLGEYGKLWIADYQGIAQSCTLYAFSNYGAYAIYGGNIPEAHQGAMKLLQWEAMRQFQKLGVQRFDFVGARIDPEPGSKQEAINSFKRRFGATLKRGYMWKYSLHPLKYGLYGLAARVRSGGDIVDAERHKLKNSGAGNS